MDIEGWAAFKSSPAQPHVIGRLGISQTRTSLLKLPLLVLLWLFWPPSSRYNHQITCMPQGLCKLGAPPLPLHPDIHNANIFATWSTSHSSITSKLWNFLSEFYLWHHALKDFVPTPTLYKYPSKISPSVFMTLFFICKYLKRRGLTLHRALPHLSSSEC